MPYPGEFTQNAGRIYAEFEANLRRIQSEFTQNSFVKSGEEVIKIIQINFVFYGIFCTFANDMEIRDLPIVALYRLYSYK